MRRLIRFLTSLHGKLYQLLQKMSLPAEKQKYQLNHVGIRTPSFKLPDIPSFSMIFNRSISICHKLGASHRNILLSMDQPYPKIPKWHHSIDAILGKTRSKIGTVHTSLTCRACTEYTSKLILVI